MSLLNEMLHDLAKQKHAKLTMPLFRPAPHPNKNKSSKRVLLLSFSMIVFVVYCFLFHKLPEKMSIKTVQIPEIKNSIEMERKSEAVMQQDPTAFLTSSEPVNLISYIEPLASSASQRVPLQLPGAPTDASNDWVEHQGEPSSTLVNKIYTPQTLEEWHDAQLNKALRAIDKGLDEEAITLLQAILIKVPNAADARENLASLYLAYGDFVHASEVVDEGLKFSPADPVLITIKARVFLEQGKAIEAIKLLSKHRPSITSYPDFYSTLAAALQSQGRILEAGSLYRSLIQVDANDGRYWLGYAIALEHNHKVNQAIEAYIRASQNPDSDPTIRDYSEKRLKILQG